MADIKALISKMTLSEKASLCSGADFWHTKAVERLGIPQIMVTDGPHGLRKQVGAADHLGVSESIEAVCFPAGCANASSFDRDLLKKLGETIGDECQAEDVAVILGPAVNIKRSPLCGRNFEYVSEDPYLAGEMAAAMIQGVQSKGIGTSVKHFAANNQEYRRLTCSSEVDMRTLREIYLPAFEAAVKKGKPDTVMCSYNKVNGEFASENKLLLTEILRDEWGFEGFVVSDWGAVNERVKGLDAGLDLEMPSSGGTTDKEIEEAVKSGKLSEEVLDKAVERILRVVFKFIENKQKGNFDKEEHHKLATKIEEESAVLLKNGGALPLSASAGTIAIIGAFAEHPRFQGGGSSHINASKITSALDALESLKKKEGYAGLDYKFAKGFTIDGEDASQDAALADEAVKIAKDASCAVIFAGLPDSFESEGYDRQHMQMPESQNALIERICAVQKNTVVVLHNGSPIEMPWIDSAASVLELYLGGEGVGEAAVNLLFGIANPCGKLAETFPLRLEDTPAYLNFPGDGKRVFYGERLFVGYRWYDAKKIPVLFPFGHGLSYTTFEYSNIRLSETKAKAEELKGGKTITVSVDVKNTGKRAGKEIVQFYVSAPAGGVQRPVKELKGFAKVALEPGETKTVTAELCFRAFAYFAEELNGWYVPAGEYTVIAAKSSACCAESVSANVLIENSEKLPFIIDGNTTLGDLENSPKRDIFMKILTDEIGGAPGGFLAAPEGEDAGSDGDMMREMLLSTPIRALRSFNNLSSETLQRILEKLKAAAE